MTVAAVPYRDDHLWADRATGLCPVCHREHALTVEGRLWTHGPLRARCRGSRLRLEAARWAARTVRGITTIHLPGEA